MIRLGLGLGIAGVAFWQVRKFLTSPTEVISGVVGSVADVTVDSGSKLFDVGKAIGNMSFKAVFPKSLGDFRRDKFNNIQESYVNSTVNIRNIYNEQLSKLDILQNSQPSLAPQISGARLRLKNEYDDATEESRVSHTENVDTLNETAKGLDKLLDRNPLVKTARFFREIF